MNKGWHQIAKEWDGGKQVISESITLDEKGDFRSLDAMAQEVVNTCILCNTVPTHALWC